jgi:hypothetical protein
VRHRPQRRASPQRVAGALVASAAGRHADSRGRTFVARCVVVIAGVLVFVASTQAAFVVGRSFVTPPSSTRPVSDEPVVLRLVEPGDTLWSIAAELSVAGDVRNAVDRLARLNGGPDVWAGESIRVPSAWIGDRP